MASCQALVTMLVVSDPSVRQLLVDLKDDGIEEQWIRETSDPQFRDVEACKLLETTWQVFVPLAKVVREEPLESEMRQQINSTLRSVEGVSNVEQVDREIWTVYGTPRGPDLVRGIALVVDRLADQREARRRVEPLPPEAKRPTRIAGGGGAARTVKIQPNGPCRDPSSVRQLRDHEEDGIEEQWIRETSDPDFRDVEAAKMHEKTWQVSVRLAEFVREEPLESEMRQQIEATLRSVDGVSDVQEMDREVWTVYGTPLGPELVRAAGEVVDRLADRARDQLEAIEVATPGAIAPTPAAAVGSPRDLAERLAAWARAKIETNGPESAAELSDRLHHDSIAGRDWPRARRTAYTTVGLALDLLLDGSSPLLLNATIVGQLALSNFMGEDITSEIEALLNDEISN